MYYVIYGEGSEEKIQQERCCEKASEGSHTKTIITENEPIWSQDHSLV